MRDAAKIDPDDRRAILLLLQIVDIGIDTLAQNTRSEPRTISRNRHLVLQWTDKESTAEHFLMLSGPELPIPEKAANSRDRAALSSDVRIILE
jgi:hypothetical protein